MRRLMFKGQGMYKRSQGCQVVKPDLEPGNVVCMPKALFLARLLCQVRNALRLREKDACFPHPWLSDTAERGAALVYCGYIFDS